MRETLDNPSRRTMLASGVAVAATLAVGSPLTTGRDPDTRPPFDVIIVGGGSAGAVLARRLNENSKRRGLLVEASHSYRPQNHSEIEIVANSDIDIVGANANPEFEWGYKSQPGYVDHPPIVGALRGKVLGDSSAITINGAVAIRARDTDFKRWNLPGWSYEELLPSFKNLETRSGGASALQGHEGPLPVHQLKLKRADVTPMQQAFINATVANGFKVVNDFDGAAADGVGPYPMNIVVDVRINTGMAYLSNEVRARKILVIRPDSLVDKVLFKGPQAIGVQLADGETLHASEVILSTGTYGSAAILLRSGVRPAANLQALNIKQVAELPVGQHLMPPPFYYNAYAAKPELIGRQSPAIGAKLWPHSSSASNGDLDLHITATHLFTHDQSTTKVGFVLAVALTRPLSQGTFTLASRDPFVTPRIDLNFLAREEDCQRLLEGIRLARKIGTLRELIHSELNPGNSNDSDDALSTSARATLDTYHPISSAPMGHGASRRCACSGCDLNARPFGLQALRVVDASIFLFSGCSVGSGQHHRNCIGREDRWPVRMTQEATQ